MGGGVPLSDLVNNDFILKITWLIDLILWKYSLKKSLKNLLLLVYKLFIQYRWLEENPNAGKNREDDDGQNVEYDADGNPIVPDKDKHIDPLAAIDHSLIKYHAFEKNFYEEHSDISTLSNIQAIDLQQKLNLKVIGGREGVV